MSRTQLICRERHDRVRSGARGDKTRNRICAGLKKRGVLWPFHKHARHLGKALHELALLTSQRVTLASMIGSASALCSAKSPAVTTAVLYRALRHKSARKRCWLNAVTRGRGRSRCVDQSSRRCRRALTHRSGWTRDNLAPEPN
jgi:hypothetical protein